MLVYTFRTFPLSSELQENFKDVFVFGRMKEDLGRLQLRIIDEKPDFVLGIAATNGYTRFEPIAINRFNNGQVIKRGPEELTLYIPTSAGATFTIARTATHTFCNWTMYQLQYFLMQEGCETKLLFAHLNPRDLPELVKLSDCLM